MKHAKFRSITKFIYVILCIGCAHQKLIAFTNQTFYVPRSQGTQVVRDQVGWETLINQSACDDFYGAFAMIPAYSRSFKPQEFVNFLLGCPVLVVSGSQSPDRGPQDILADYFGLAPDYKSLLCFEPKIGNFVLDLNFYFGLDHVVNGLYVRLNAPITQTTWDLNMLEFIKNQGVASYPAGYMSEVGIPNSSLVTGPVKNSAATFLRGIETFGDMSEPLAYGKIFQRQIENRIAELRGVVGYNWTGDAYHAGLNFRVSAPTGTRPEGEFLFEPIVGNGKHWEVGGGVTAHYDVWSCPEQVSDIGLYFDANVVHLCNASQKRSFDLINNGFGSRYMLVQEMANSSNNLFLGLGGPASTYQYRGFLAPAINYTTLNIRTSFGVQADLALTCAYHRRGLSVDFGYNFFGRSAEKLQCRELFPSNLYALKGDAQLYGFDAVAPSTIVPLAATQSGATLQAGQRGGNANFANNNIDSPINAADSARLLKQLTTADAATFGITQTNVNTSNPSVLLQDSDIDTCGALLPGTFCQGLFFHISHVWRDEEDIWKPFLGVGGEVEWANGDAPSTCSQWEIWLKGGIGF